MKKRVLSLLLVLAMTLTMVPAVWAQETAEQPGTAPTARQTYDISAGEAVKKSARSTRMYDEQYESGGFYFEIWDETDVAVVGAVDPTGDVVIPDNFEGKPVSYIGNEAFANCAEMTSVTIPNTVKGISVAAFFGCSGLTSVTLPDSVETLSDAAFADCTSLREINLPPNLYFMGGWLFQNCPITSITFPSGQIDFAGNPFWGCETITEFKVPEDGQLSVVDGVLMSKDQTILYVYPSTLTNTSYTIPSTVTRIHTMAFSMNAALETLVVPDSVKGIREMALGYCSNLKSVSLGSGLEYMEMNAFRACESLESVTFDPDCPLQVIWDGVFGECTALQQIVLPNHVHTLRNNAFMDSTALCSVTLPDSLERICYNTFVGCTSLTELTLPEGVKSLSRGAFENSGLVSINRPDSLSYVYCDAFAGTSVDIEDYVGDDFEDMYQAYIRGTEVGLAGTEHYDYANEVLTMVNQERSKEGLAPLTMDANLTELAMQRAAEIAVYFSHDRPCGESVVDCAPNVWAENVAYGQIDPSGVMDSWMNSDGHRANILTDGFVSIGVGCFIYNGVCYWVQVFGLEEAEPMTTTGTVDRTRQILVRTDADLESTGYTPAEEEDHYTTGGFSPLYTMELSETSYTAEQGQEIQMDAYVTTNDKSRCYDQSFFEWESSDPTVASVENGVVKALCAGQTVIRATFGTLSAQATLTVTEPKPTEPEVTEPKPTDPTVSSAEFTDVKEGQWFYDTVQWAVAEGITNGTGDGKFSPDATCTRNQVVTFLWRAAGSPEPASTKNPFVDVKESDYFYKAVLWAVENGVTTGMDATHFNPNGDCTRGQVVTFLHRAAGKPAPASTKNPFTDVGKDYYTDAVLWAVGEGITTGMTSTTFAPNATCTRAQIVTFLYRAQE